MAALLDGERTAAEWEGSSAGFTDVADKRGMVRFENLQVHTDCSMEHPVMSNSESSIYINLIYVVIPISLCPTVLYFDIQVIHLISHPSLHLFVEPYFFFLMLLYGTNPSFLALQVLHVSFQALLPHFLPSSVPSFRFLFCLVLLTVSSYLSLLWLLISLLQVSISTFTCQSA